MTLRRLQVVQSVAPREDHRVGVQSVKVLHDALLEFVHRIHADAAQQRPRQLAEGGDSDGKPNCGRVHAREFKENAVAGAARRPGPRAAAVPALSGGRAGALGDEPAGSFADGRVETVADLLRQFNGLHDRAVSYTRRSVRSWRSRSSRPSRGRCSSWWPSSGRFGRYARRWGACGIRAGGDPGRQFVRGQGRAARAVSGGGSRRSAGGGGAARDDGGCWRARRRARR